MDAVLSREGPSRRAEGPALHAGPRAGRKAQDNQEVTAFGEAILCALAALLLIPAAALAGAPAVAVPSDDTIEKGHVIRLSPPDEYRGSIDIRLYPDEGRLGASAELLLTDPAGRRLGKDPATGAAYNEIPVAFYEGEGTDDDETGETGPETMAIDIGSPAEGEYVLHVIGKEVGRYSLDILTFTTDFARKPVPESFTAVATKPGQVDEYRFTFKP